LPNFLLILGHRTVATGPEREEKKEEYPTSVSTKGEGEYVAIVGERNNVKELVSYLLKSEEAVCTEIEVGPLGLEEIVRMVKDSLPHATNPYEPLAKFLLRNTAGNPFFVRQLMYTLAKNKAFQLHSDDPSKKSSSNSYWSWDLESIERQFPLPTDNVISLLVDNINKLPETTKRILNVASVFGSKFDCLLLSKLPASILSLFTTTTTTNYAPYSSSTTILPSTTAPVVGSLDSSSLSRVLEVRRHLGVALQERLIVPSCSRSSTRTTLPQQSPLPEDTCLIGILESTPQHYAFVHDRVHQAIYAQLREEQVRELHLAVGRLLLKEREKDPSSVDLFDAMSHINQGAPHLLSASGIRPGEGGGEFSPEQEEVLQLALLNLVVSKKAKDSMAYQCAFDYASVGLYLLGFLPSLPSLSSSADLSTTTTITSLRDHQSSSDSAFFVSSSSIVPELNLNLGWPTDSEQRQLCLDLHLAYCVTGYLSGNIEPSRRCLTGLLEDRLTNPLERARASLKLVILETNQGNPARAVQVARLALKELDVRLPNSATELNTGGNGADGKEHNNNHHDDNNNDNKKNDEEGLAEYIKVETQKMMCSFQSRSVQSLLEEQEMIDTRVKVAMALLNAIFSPTFIIHPTLAQVVVILLVKVYL
jgi:predicted ATPase